jgi:hypothetical protein
MHILIIVFFLGKTGKKEGKNKIKNTVNMRLGKTGVGCLGKRALARTDWSKGSLGKTGVGCLVAWASLL